MPINKDIIIPNRATIFDGYLEIIEVVNKFLKL